MSREEHYFENLLHYGKDIEGEPNKEGLSKEVQETIEMRAWYVIYQIFHGRDMFLDYVGDAEEVDNADSD